MAKSAEYPDLTWVTPAAYGTGRDGKAVRYIVIHYTAGAERNTSAEDGASYDARRTDGVSTHYFVDSNSVVQCVLTRDRGNAARTKGNRLGIQYELCGTVQTRAQWMDAASLPTLRNAAKQVARDCKKYGIPVRRLTVAQTRSAWYDFPDGPKGIVGHVDCTNAYPEDGGDHTDPGPEFPWDAFLAMVWEEMEEKVAVTSAEITAIANAVLNAKIGDVANPGRTVVDVLRDGAKLRGVLVGDPGDTKNAALPASSPLAKLLASPGLILAAVDADLNEGAIAGQVLAGLTAEKIGEAIRASGLTAEAIADALPEEMAADVAQNLANRLAS